MGLAVQFRNVSKRFTLSHTRPRSLQEAAIRLLSFRAGRGDEEPFWALRDVSFDIAPGRTVGLVGTNGSGKSTALKLMTGILQPTGGEIEVNGRVSALLELGSGMHPELTGRENVFLNGSLLGLSNAEMARLYPDIVAFSEIGRFIDMPVKHYSSGMYMRLGFSVAIHTQPDVLLLDEVLAVGDQAFQTRCLDRIYDLRRAGTTIVMVSHGLETLHDMCDELIWLRDGALAMHDRTAAVSQGYLRHINQTLAARDEHHFAHAAPQPGQRWGSGEIEIVAVRLRRGGVVTDTFQTGDPLTLEMDFVAREPVHDPMFGLAIHHSGGTHLSGPNNKLADLSLGTVQGRGTLCYTIPDLPLMAGTYELSVAVHDSQGLHAFDYQNRAYSFHVRPGGTRELYGMIRMEGQWSYHTQPAPPAAPAPALVAAR